MQVKNFRLYVLYVLATIFLITNLGCKKTVVEEVQVKIAPTNLQIVATVATDGSGNVSFNAKADNANQYRFEFGTGDTREEPSGIIQYKYTQNGTNTYTVSVTATSASGLTLTGSKNISVNVDLSIVKASWSDEFDVNGPPDPTKWVYDIGTGSNGWGNAELQYYTDRLQNVVVENGLLKIKASREAFSGSTWTSARIKSLGKFAFTYGTVEIRAKVPAGFGTWPAVWMLGADFPTAGWPNCGEIDILEHVGKEKDKVFASLHYPGRAGGNAVTSTKIISNATTEFHVFRLDWTSASIKFSVDGVVFHTVTNSISIPFNKDFFLLVNLAMGGNFGGPVDSGLSSATFEVDYIRVYK